MAFFYTTLPRLFTCCRSRAAVASQRHLPKLHNVLNSLHTSAPVQNGSSLLRFWQNLLQRSTARGGLQLNPDHVRGPESEAHSSNPALSLKDVRSLLHEAIRVQQKQVAAHRAARGRVRVVVHRLGNLQKDCVSQIIFTLLD